MTRSPGPKQRALVTGASAGIGNAYARELAKRGFDLTIVARNTAKLDDLAAELSREHAVSVDVITADLATAEGMDRVADAVADASKPVELLVNNAGASLSGWFGTTDIADEDRQLDLMVRAPMHLTDAAIKAMTERGHGKIINVASVGAFTPRGSYSAHKMWIVNLCRWANLHYADKGLTIMAVCPGFTRTEFHRRMDASINDIPGWMWLRAEQVVTASLRDLDKGKAVSVPTVRYTVLAALAQHLPSGIVARIAKKGR